MKKLKAQGTQGSWFAKVENQSFPCVHDYWCRSSWPNYLDPGMKPGDRKIDEYVEAVKKGTVILTRDEVVSENPLQFRRTEYVGVFEVEGVSAGEFGLSFRFAGKTCELI